MYPDASIPIVQISLHSSLNPSLHIRAGRALAPFRNENILIVGSGLTYHNLKAMSGAGREISGKFDAWLHRAVVGMKGEKREMELCRWEDAPCARKAHPREEHLIPLMVIAGAAEGEGSCFYREEGWFGGLVVSSYVV